MVIVVPVRSEVMGCERLAHPGEASAEAWGVFYGDACAPSHEVPAHLVDSARPEAHRDGAVLVPIAGLGRVEQEVSGIVRCVLVEAEHDLEGVLLEHPE